MLGMLVPLEKLPFTMQVLPYAQMLLAPGRRCQ
jgi:hypothetical protein